MLWGESPGRPTQLDYTFTLEPEERAPDLRIRGTVMLDTLIQGPPSLQMVTIPCCPSWHAALKNTSRHNNRRNWMFASTASQRALRVVTAASGAMSSTWAQTRFNGYSGAWDYWGQAPTLLRARPEDMSLSSKNLRFFGDRAPKKWPCGQLIHQTEHV